ncbi:transglycosylase SLT domain-containing protein [Streptomyces sp. NPDC008343]|uniref:transglycosylase SLT domain-containing protein n=1 Tax=Streptomyces sp. NPDC008343 TaxID=3364828 RepID=UPI0036EB55A1
MQLPKISKLGQLAKARKYSMGIAAASVAVMACTVAVAPIASADTGPTDTASVGAPADTGPTDTASVDAPADTGSTDTPSIDTWINESLAVMQDHNIPGSHDGILKNLLRESSGNPNAINNWDSNARAGTPSKGLMQVIDPTFQQYHVDGTSWDIYDPVANITAACNYAAHVYGSIDKVNSAY